MTVATKARKPKAPPSILDNLVSAGPEAAIAMLLWKNRHANPQMSVQVEEKDCDGLKQCLDFLEITKPQIRILRPPGTPATPGREALGNRRAVMPHPGTPPKNYVVIQMVDQDGNAFVPIENNEEDAKLRDATRAKQRMKDRAPLIAEQLLNELATGGFTDGTIREAAISLVGLAKAVQ